MLIETELWNYSKISLIHGMFTMVLALIDPIHLWEPIPLWDLDLYQDPDLWCDPDHFKIRILSRISLLGIRLKESRLLDPTFWDPTYLYLRIDMVGRRLGAQDARLLRNQPLHIDEQDWSTLLLLVDQLTCVENNHAESSRVFNHCSELAKIFDLQSRVQDLEESSWDVDSCNKAWGVSCIGQCGPLSQLFHFLWASCGRTR